jgi:hypothetical protein
MKIIRQSLDEILDSLQSLEVDWKDETATRGIDRLRTLPEKAAYGAEDIASILDANFDDGLLIFRLFLGHSKDQFEGELKNIRDGKGAGITGYRADAAGYIDDLLRLGLSEAMTQAVNRKPHWSDILVERLRSGRGSAISGQKRGRDVENFAETIIRKVFGDSFQARCTFTGQRGREAKCDFAIPSKTAPRIVIEAKGYAATGSKMTDILGDVQKIIDAKRPDTAFLFFTDGLTWKQRKSDLRKLVEHQNDGDIMRIYTYAMAEQFEEDLRALKAEGRL